MRGRLLVASIVGATAFTLAGTASAGSEQLSVAVDRTTVSTALGHKFLFRSTISNEGTTAAANLIAHLNVLSLRQGVYVDPEDWSSHRTRYLPPIPAGRSLMVTWGLQAVNSGTIGLYVAVLPQSGPARPPTTGPLVRVSIAGRRTLNSGGVLPLALGMPALLGALSVSIRLTRRSRRSARDNPM
jgi:hypothetical protein